MSYIFFVKITEIFIKNLLKEDLEVKYLLERYFEYLKLIYVHIARHSR